MPGPEPLRSFTVLAEALALRDGAVDAMIFADGSYSWQTRCGGWGAWICTTGVRGFAASGQVAAQTKHSTEVEMCALTHAVGAARPYLRAGDAVLLHSDSANALRWVLGAYAKAKDWPHDDDGLPLVRVTRGAAGSAALAGFVSACAALDLVIFTRHVGGHQADRSMRHAIQSRCDKLAQRQRRAAEARLRTKGPP